MKGIITFVFLVVFYLLATQALHANGDTPTTQIPYTRDQWGKFLDPSINTKLVPRGAVEAWESYPSGLFFSRGKQYKNIEPELEYTVIGKKSFPNIFGGYDYFLQIKPSDPQRQNDPCLKEGCWIYQGKDDSKVPESLLAPGYVLSPPKSRIEE